MLNIGTNFVLSFKLLDPFHGEAEQLRPLAGVVGLVRVEVGALPVEALLPLLLLRGLDLLEAEGRVHEDGHHGA